MRKTPWYREISLTDEESRDLDKRSEKAEIIEYKNEIKKLSKKYQSQNTKSDIKMYKELIKDLS